MWKSAFTRDLAHNAVPRLLQQLFTLFSVQLNTRLTSFPLSCDIVIYDYSVGLTSGEYPGTSLLTHPLSEVMRFTFHVLVAGGSTTEP